MTGPFSPVDWHRILAPDIPLLEIFIRGTAMYLGLFVLFRIALKREVGSMGITDLLVVVVIADAAQNGMAGEYHSISDGLILSGVIIFWSHALEWLSFRFTFLRPLLSPPPVPLIKNGKLIKKNMRRELMTEEDVLSQLRQQGVEKVEDVKEAMLEEDGHFSVVRRKG